jgi:hypothetical protein
MHRGMTEIIFGTQSIRMAKNREIQLCKWLQARNLMLYANKIKSVEKQTLYK